MTGTLSPDATGNYEYDGAFGGTGSYKRVGDTYWLWWDTAIDYWVLGSERGTRAAAHWVRAPGITGNYEPMGGPSGTATVARI